MAEKPVLADYVRLIITLFELFKQHRSEQFGSKRGRPFTYTEEMFIIFFMLMQFRRIHAHKAKWRWLTRHPEMLDNPERDATEGLHKDTQEQSPRFRRVRRKRAGVSLCFGACPELAEGRLLGACVVI